MKQVYIVYDSAVGGFANQINREWAKSGYEVLGMMAIPADEEHKKHIEQIKSLHDVSKSADGIKNKKNAAKKRRADVESKKEAKEIFEKFKAGEKLSTEDLMTLQKSGYL